jgi:transcription elongation factor GreA
LAEVENEFREKLLDAIQEKNWTEVEEIWLQVVEGPPQPALFHEAVAHRLAARKHTDRLRDMYLALLEQRVASRQFGEALRICETLLAQQPTIDWIRAHLAAALRGFHSDYDTAKLEEFLEDSGIVGESADLARCLSRFEELVGATKGQVFRHRKWGLGVVRSLDHRTNRVTIDFEEKPGQVMTLDGVAEFLERIPKDHILAQMATDGEALKAEGLKDPGRLLHLALKSSKGRMKVTDLKRLLTMRFMSEEEYRRFWASARDAIKLDPWIDLKGTGANAELSLRAEPRSFLDAVVSRIESPKSIADLREAMRDIARHGDDAELSGADVTRLHETFAKAAANPRLSAAERLNRALIYEEFRDSFGDASNPLPLAELLLGLPPDEAMEAVGLHELRRVALEFVRGNLKEKWVGYFVEAFPYVDSRTAAWADKELERSGHTEDLQHARESALSRPERNPELFIWGVRNILDGKWKFPDGAFPPILLVEELITLLNIAYDASKDEVNPGSSEARNTLGRIRSFLQEGQAKYMRAVVKSAGAEENRRLLSRIHLCDALVPSFKENVERFIYTQHPSIKKISKQEEEEERRKPAFHYALPESVDRKRQELSHILNTEIPANTRLIEAARALGDLRENADYHAAKDQQRLLMQKAAELEELISRARIIELDKVEPTQSRFGTRVTVKRQSDGALSTYTILGMWEADAPRNILSYLTPFASQLMNRKVGEVFNVATPDGRVEAYEMMEVQVHKP